MEKKNKKIVVPIFIIIILVIATISGYIILDKNNFLGTDKSNSSNNKVASTEKNPAEGKEKEKNEETTIENSEIVKIFNNNKISNIECIQRFEKNENNERSHGKITIIAKSEDGNKVWENIKEIENIYPDATTKPFSVINYIDKKLYVFYLIDGDSYEEFDSQINIIDLETGKTISEVKTPYLYKPAMAITKDGHKIIAGFGSQGAYNLEFVVLNSNDLYEKKVNAGIGEITVNTIDTDRNLLKTLEIVEENNKEYLTGRGYSMKEDKEYPNIIVPIKAILEKDVIKFEDCIVK